MRRLLPVAVAFVVLLALVVAKELGRPSARSLSEEAGFVPVAVEAFGPQDVQAIEVSAPGAEEPTFRVVREGERWLVTTPFRAPADAGKVEELAQTLAQAAGEPRTSDASLLADYDLTDERATRVAALGREGKLLAKVAVGRSSGQRGAFVRILAGRGEPGTAYAVTADLRGALGLGRTPPGEAPPASPEPSRFHDTSFPSSPTAGIERIEVVAPGRRVVLAQEEGAWRAVEGGPAGAEVNEQGIEELLGQWGGALRPTALVDPARAAPLPEEGPPHAVTFEYEDGTTRAVYAARDEGGDYHVRLGVEQDPPVIYEVPQWTAERLFPTGAGLFELEPLTVSDAELLRVEVAGKGREPIVLARESGQAASDWRVLAPQWPLAPRQSALRSLASLLRGVRPTDYVDRAGLEEVELSVRFGPDAESLREVRIGGQVPAGEDRLALLPGRGDQVYVLPESTVTRLAPEPLSLFEPRLFHGFTAPEVTSVEVSGETPFRVERGDEGWTLVHLVTDEREPASEAAVEAWLGRLLQIEVAEAAPPAESAPAGGGTQVTVGRAEGAPATFTLLDGQARAGSLVFPLGEEGLVPAPSTLAASAEPAEAPGDEDDGSGGDDLPEEE